MKPFFSVVIPTYNRAEKLRRTIESVLAQSFRNFEVLVMDDGSTDDTRAVVEAFDDSRIRYDWAPNSGGPATPRNRGIDAATADWVCFLDADDLWHPDKLDQVARCIEGNPGADLICHDVVTSVEASGEKFTSRCGPFERDLYRVMLTEGNQVITSAATVRREFLDRHGLRFNTSPDYVIVEDYDLWLRIALAGGRFCQIRQPLGVYVIERGNISSDLTRFNRNHMTLLKAHVYHLQTFDPDKDRLWRKITSHLMLDRARALIAENRFASGIQSLLGGFRGAPASSILYIGSKFARRIRKYVP
jgi:glycosyltransferase involved in cell wall biosynthesis